MSQALIFNDVQLVPVSHNNQPWIRSAELATALGYASEKSVSNLYARNADEFTNEMSVVINLMTGDIPTETRIFSLRGCHLLAMFARTSIAKAFRVWVLDVLETLGRAEQRPALDTSSRLSTRKDPERKELHALVNTWVGCAPLHYAAVCSIINAHIGVSGVDEMTVAQVRRAIEFARGKIAEATEIKALPAAPEHLPDSCDAYRMMREDIDKLVNKIGWLMGYMRFRGPRSVPLNQLDLGNSIRRSIGDCIAALYEAQSHLADANRLTLMIKL